MQADACDGRIRQVKTRVEDALDERLHRHAGQNLRLVGQLDDRFVVRRQRNTGFARQLQPPLRVGMGACRGETESVVLAAGEGPAEAETGADRIAECAGPAVGESVAGEECQVACVAGTR